MALQNIIVPQMGESIHEVILIKLYKKVGDKINVGDTLADVATDKVDTEIIATATGTIQNIFFTKEKSVIPIGATFATVGDEQKHTIETPVSNQPEQVVEKPKVIEPPRIETKVTPPVPQINTPPPVVQITQPIAQEQTKVVPMNTHVGYLSPIVTKLIFEYGIQPNELLLIPATGTNGRITKQDLFQYIQTKQQPTSSPSPSPITEVNYTTPSPSIENQQAEPNAYVGKTTMKNNSDNGETVVPLDRMRLAISKNLKQSKDTNVQVTSFAEIDVSNMVVWREKNKQEFEKVTGQKLTYTPLLVEAIVATLQKYPILNGVLKGDSLIERTNINIGIATALPDGNLIVPIVKQCQNLNLVELTTQLQTIITKARNNQLNYADIDGGTFTLTNIGTFNSLMGTPILPPYQSGILATGMIQKKPIVQNTIFGEALVIRHMMFVSLSYDHRIIDGIIGGSFLNDFAKRIESFDVNKSFSL